MNLLIHNPYGLKLDNSPPFPTEGLTVVDDNANPYWILSELSKICLQALLSDKKLNQIPSVVYEAMIFGYMFLRHGNNLRTFDDREPSLIMLMYKLCHLYNSKALENSSTAPVIKRIPHTHENSFSIIMVKRSPEDTLKNLNVNWYSGEEPK